VTALSPSRAVAGVAIACALLIGASQAASGWHTEPALPLARGEVAAATVGGEIAVVGGFLATGASSARVDVYSPTTARWRRLPDLPVTLNHALAAGGAGKVYVAGGYGSSGRLRRAWMLDRGRWRALPRLPYGLAAGGAAFLGGRLYLVAGVAGPLDRSVLVRHMLVIDPARPDRWRLAPAPTPREHLAVTVAMGRIYALGGRTAGYDTNLSLVESWRPGERTWRIEQPLPEARGGTGAAAVSNVIVSVGGEAPPGTISSVYGYDVSGRTWRRLPDLPTARHGLAVAAAQGKIFAVGGGRTPGLAVSNVAESFQIG
jgi:N-acetylneuraminic acid mutarotase